MKAGTTNIHNLREIPDFASTQEITNFFHKAEVPISILKLASASTNNFILAAYPYSGKSTIDIFLFVKYGDQWVVKMLYYYLRPKYRKLDAKEDKGRIIIRDKGEEIFSIVDDKKLNAVDRW